jgi:hypothetical protein
MEHNAQDFDFTSWDDEAQERAEAIEEEVLRRYEHQSDVERMVAVHARFVRRMMGHAPY